MALITNCSGWSFGVITDEEDDTVLNITIDDDTPVISDDMKDDINIYVNLILRGSIAVFGTGGNVINMLVFFKHGLKDSNSVGLMALSFTDFVVTFLGIIGTICFTWDTFYPDTAIDPVDFEYVTVGWVRDVAYLISGWITTLLSVERCVCVVSPFKVRQIFTRGRCLVVIFIIYVVNIGVHMPVFLSQWLAWAVVDCSNENGTVVITERMILHVSDNRNDIQIYIDIANGAVLPFPSQAIVLISVIWMVVGLQASSRIRKSAQEAENNSSGGGGGNNKSSKSSKLSGKESRLIKVVLFLAIILTVCNIPRFLAVYAKQIFKEVSLGKKYSNLYVFLWNISALAQIINSSVNIFVYLIVNNNYRQTVKYMFGFGKKIVENSEESSTRITSK